jgi:hypothetical protein
MQTVLTEKVMIIGTLILTLILTVCIYIINLIHLRYMLINKTILVALGLGLTGWLLHL